MNPKISVIIPVYKVEKYLDQCISSVVNQTYRNLEIILIDDGSPDRCPFICDEWTRKDKRIQVIHKPNGGLSSARNAGLDAISGEYLTFVDSDDWLEPQYVESMYSAMVDNNAQICSAGSTCFFESTGKVQIQKKTPFVGDRKRAFRMLYDQCKFPVDATPKMYSTEVWKDLRFPVGKNYEDAFTTYLLIDRANTIVQTGDTFYNYRVRENSIMHSPFSSSCMAEEEAWRMNYLFMKDHYPSIFPAAKGFYLQRVVVIERNISKEHRTVFFEERSHLRRIIRSNRWFMLFRSGLPIKQKVKYFVESVW